MSEPDSYAFKISGAQQEHGGRTHLGVFVPGTPDTGLSCQPDTRVSLKGQARLAEEPQRRSQSLPRNLRGFASSYHSVIGETTP